MAVLEGMEHSRQRGRDTVRRDVVQLVRIVYGVVVLLLAARVPYVEGGRGAHRLVGGRVPGLLGLPVRIARREVRAVVLDENGLPPVRLVLPVPQSGQAATVDVGRDGNTSEGLERGAQVDVGRQQADH